MKILLDESLPRRLKKDFLGSVKTVPEMGWQGKKNGELLKLMDSKFDFFITADQNLQYQYNLRTASIVIIVLKAFSNRYDDLKPLVKKCVKRIKSDKLKGVIVID